MRTSPRNRNRTLRQNVRLILLTALVVAIQMGYLHLGEEAFPQESPVPEAVNTQAPSSDPSVVGFASNEHR